MRAVLLTLAALVACAAASSSDKKIVCYFGSWAIYRPGNGNFLVTDIDPLLCTHLIYTFIGITTDGSVNSLDPWADYPSPDGRNGFNLFNQLRNQNPSLKTMIAVGGWNEGSVKYSTMVANPTARRNFVENAVAFVKKWGFNGLDFDWEYPNQRGGLAADVQNYVLLLKELRERFDQEGLLLSAAVGAAQSSASLSYDIPQVSKYLHFINLMAYDLHGAWDKKTGINAPLYPASWERGDDRFLNVEACVAYWLSQGAPAEKIVLGMALYGRTFTLDNPTVKGIGAAAASPGTAGPYTREAGTIGYNEICEQQRTGTWETYYEEEQRVPYTIKGNQWIGYEDPRSLGEKAAFVNRLGLGGAMVWSIETDDFHGICGEKYPLLKTLNHALKPSSVPPPPPPSTSTTTSTTCRPSTTTQSSQGPQGGQHGPFECTQAGYYRDYNDCSVFYVCVADPQRTFIRYMFTCPSGLKFDTTIKVCNWPANVDCTKSYA